MSKVVAGAILSILGLLVLAFVINCYTNNSDMLRTIANPMRENLILFYQKHQRHPDFKETQELLKASGCTHVKEVSRRDWGAGNIDANFYCFYKRKNIGIETKITPRVVPPYSLEFDIKKSRCYLFQDREGRVDPVGRCYQDSCLFLNRSH